MEPMNPRPELLVEPFCGGATVSLTALDEGLARRCLMAELDHDVAAFWHAALGHNAELCKMVADFTPTPLSVCELADRRTRSLLEHGFLTLVLNRTRRGGILAPGASLIRNGENNKGITSRWYPKTIISRLQAIAACASSVDFRETDGMTLLEAMVSTPSTVYFIDPPYTAGGKRAGSRLYAHHEINHRHLFDVLANSEAEFLMTYDKSSEIIELVHEHHFAAVEVKMNNAHHDQIPELLITRFPAFVT